MEYDKNLSGISVCMFGGFSMYYGDRKLEFKGNGATKAMQILKLLLARYPDSISKEAMLREIFEYDDVLNPNNNLKVSISQLRKAFSSFHLPWNDFICYADGSYYWNYPLAVLKDTDEFEACLKFASAANSISTKMMHLKKAIAYYKGGFLPELLGVDFAEKLSVYYYDKYAKAVRELAAMYLEQGEYTKGLELYTSAAQLNRCEEWQTGIIECLMKTSRWEEAKRVYHETVLTLDREFGVGPSKELLEKYRTISEKTDNAVSSFENMLSSVVEDTSSSGAYYCAFPGFVDAVRLFSRNMERNGASCYLMMIFLGDSSGNVIKNEERLSQGATALFDAIQNSLRKGDSFTQYNKSQFLVFLYGTSRENCDIVSKRIMNNYKKTAVRATSIRFEVTSAILNGLENIC